MEEVPRELTCRGPSAAEWIKTVLDKPETKYVCFLNVFLLKIAFPLKLVLKSKHYPLSERFSVS